MTTEKTETSDRQLNAVDAAAVDALPRGHALLVVQRGPGAGSRFLLDTDEVNAGRHPDSEIFLDDVTVSRRHAEFHREGEDFTVSDVGSLNGTYVNRDRIDRVQLKRRRRGPDRQVPPGLLRRTRERLTCSRPQSSARGRMNIGEVLDRLRPDFPGITIPKIRFLEDKGLIKPERTPAGYRKFTAEDVDRLRYVLRMQRDHYLPLKVIGEHLDAIDRGPRAAADRGRGADRAQGGAGRRRPAEPGVVHPPGQPRGCPGASWSRSRRSPRSSSTSSSSTA